MAKKKAAKKKVVKSGVKARTKSEVFGTLADGGHVRIGVGEDGEIRLHAEPVVKELEHQPQG